MKYQRLQRASLILFAASALLEVGMRSNKFQFDDEPLMLGISLALVLVSIAMNVSIVRKMGVPQKVKTVSQWIGIVVSAYAFLLYVVIPQ
uniref:hypothetical protein n=1 Tax=Roseivirga sp. TaxID=1964215 RepID=UPI004048DEFF